MFEEEKVREPKEVKKFSIPETMLDNPVKMLERVKPFSIPCDSRPEEAKSPVGL